MGWDIAQCEDEELIKIADRLNRCRESKVMLDLELSNEEFKLKHIHRRRQMATSKARTRMMYIIPFTLVEIGCIVGFVSSVIELKTVGYNEVAVISMLVTLMGVVFCGLICIQLWLPQVKLFGKLNPFSTNMDADKGNVTFEIERQKSEERISVLRAEINTVEDEIKHLSAKKRERELFIRTQLLEEKAKVFLGEKPADDNLKAPKSSLSFSVKKEEISDVQAEELLKGINEELAILERTKTRLQLEDKKLQDRIIEIDENIYGVKEQVIRYILIGAILTIIVSCFEGVVMHVLGGIWCLIMLPYMIWLINVCKEPVVSYLVEHDHKQIQDYAFTHSLTPVYKKRKELAKDLAHCIKEINVNESKKQEIENLGLL